MISDFHTHILPGIDDGSSSLDESIQMLKAESNIRRVVLTPHFYANYHSLEDFLTKREESYKMLKKEMEKYSCLPELLLGAEVSYFRGIGQWSDLKKLKIQETDYILIEMPPPPWSEHIYNELGEIYTNLQLIPVIAHIDRYISPFRTYNIPQKLNCLPIPLKVQANTSFFNCIWTKNFACELLKNDYIHILGSDAHNLKSRPPDLGNAIKVIEKKLGKTAINKICSYENKIFKRGEREK